MQCRRCLTQVNPGDKFCNNCGEPVIEQTNYGEQLAYEQEVELVPEDSLFKKIFSKIFIFVFMSGILIACILLLKYLMF